MLLPLEPSNGDTSFSYLPQNLNTLFIKCHPSKYFSIIVQRKDKSNVCTNRELSVFV